MSNYVYIVVAGMAGLAMLSGFGGLFVGIAAVWLESLEAAFLALKLLASSVIFAISSLGIYNLGIEMGWLEDD